jgi:NADH:ubiquinone oxidoreductase subunit
MEILMSLGTRLFTWLHGTYVGGDDHGNRYYRGRPIGGRQRERRWVIYAGEAEASKVPSEWHGWLHGTADASPKAGAPRHDWQKDHLPNLTGTELAYRPPGHTLAGGKRAPATGDYEPWTPN